MGIYTLEKIKNIIKKQNIDVCLLPWCKRDGNCSKCEFDVKNIFIKAIESEK